MSATINVADLVSEFGTYLNQKGRDIFTSLTQPTVSMNYMTTVVSDSLEWRAAHATIGSILQGFQKKWTAKGTPKFTPLSIVQRRHKFDVEFYPDEIFETWLGFLADESKDRKEWPIVRYIIENLLIPQVAHDREIYNIFKGDYEAPVDGVAQAVGKSMDGLGTILEDEYASGTSSINFINDEADFLGAPTPRS